MCVCVVGGGGSHVCTSRIFPPSSNVCLLVCSYLTYIKLWTVVKRNESMAHVLQAQLKEPQTDENKRGPRPQDLIRLYDIILQVHTHLMYPTKHTWSPLCVWLGLTMEAGALGLQCYELQWSYTLESPWES